MALRAKRPLNPDAVQAADNDIYAKYQDDPRPNALYDADGNRRPLSATDPTQAAARREWMLMYAAKGGQLETPDAIATQPGNPVQPCPSGPAKKATGDETHVRKDKANLHVQLVHKCDASPLDGGTVDISGPETHNGKTGADGWQKFDGITPGKYHIKGTHPTHHDGTDSATAPAGTTTVRVLPLQAIIKVQPDKNTHTVVLDKSGNAPAAFPILEFKIEGPPNHFFDMQLSRHAAGDLTGGPGLAKSWIEKDGRDARMLRKVFSSWSNGEKTLKLDGSGKATYHMPLEWWRDQARTPRAKFKEFKYHFRVIAFKTAATPVCAYSTADGDAKSPVVTLRNNLMEFHVRDLGWANAAKTDKSIRMEITVREPNTTDMYTFVQWKQGGRERYAPPATPGAAPVMSRDTVRDYDLTHDSNYPVQQIDRVHTNPRYWDGVYKIDAPPKPLANRRMWALDAPSGDAAVDGTWTHHFTHIDFSTRVHLNFEVPAAVTINRKDGSAPVFGVVVGVMANPQPITLDAGTWRTRVLLTAHGATRTVTHPETFAHP